MADRVGQHIDDYRLIRLLGTGSFGQVYLGEHLENQTPAAVKMLSLSQENLREFIKEASTTFRLKHPHIIPLLAFGMSADDTPYLVMDYASNGTLRQRHPKGTRLLLDTIISYLLPLAEALQYAHDKRVIHRDVKPENVLIGQDGKIMLSDFGIAVIAPIEQSLNTQNLGGTAPYMAPEQTRGKPLPASDQYALGIMAYEWLCGVRPFQGTVWELLDQHRSQSPPLLREKLPDLPPMVEEIIFRALAKDPHDRFTRVQDFATALEIACRDVLAQPFPAADSPINLRTPLNPTLSREVFPVVLTQTPTGVNPTPQNQDSGSMLAPIYEERDMAISTSHLSQSGGLTPLSPESFPLSTGTAPAENRAYLGRRRISRRVVIASVAGIIGLGGSILTIDWASSAGLLGTHGSPPLTTTPGGTVHATSTPSLSSPTSAPLIFPSLLYTYTGHSDSVRAVAWSPDDQYIASAAGNVSFNPPAKDQTVQVWDATNGNHLSTYLGKGTSLYGYGASAVAWSPGSKKIVSGVNDQSVEVWNALDGGNEFIYPGYGSLVNTVVWSPDGKRIASGYEDGKVKIWDAAGGGLIKTYLWISLNACHALAWSPDSISLAAANYDGTIQIWNTATGGQLVTLGQQDQGGAHGLYALTWSPDGQRIASGGLASPVQVWNVAEKTTAFLYTGHSGGITAVSWSPDGKYIASGGSDRTIQIWKAADGNHVFTYNGHKDTINAITWSPTSKRVASASSDQTVQVWCIA